jgi:hypothetical protein
VEITKRAYSTDDFCNAFSIGKTKLYDLLGSGQIIANKVGGKTVIPHDEAERWLKSLPSYSHAKRPGGPGRHPQAA